MALATKMFIEVITELPLPLLSHVLSNHLSPVLLRPTSTSPKTHIAYLSHFLTGAFEHLLFTYPNHLSLTSPILSTMGPTPTLSRISAFLIFFIFWMCRFLTVQYSAPYNIAGLATTLWNLGYARKTNCKTRKPAKPML